MSDDGCYNSIVYPNICLAHRLSATGCQPRSVGRWPLAAASGQLGRGALVKSPSLRVLARGLVVSFFLCFLLLLHSGIDVDDVQAEGRHVDAIRANGVVNPVMARYIDRAISAAESDGAQALIIQLDTPGGLDTSMREIMQRMLAARVPVVVYVAPSGARAASAGLFITITGHVAAMAPSTNIGSAHPVSIGSDGQTAPMDPVMTDKVVNDAVALITGVASQRGRNAQWAEKAVRESVNVTASEALDLKVVDLVADDMDDLLEKLDGRQVSLAAGTVTLHTQGAVVSWLQMSFVEELLNIISDPNLAYILFIIGLNGLIYELASPGSIIPGVVGAISLILAFFALGTLPINLAGVALIVLAFLLFAVDIFAPTHGALTLGGVLALVLGSMMLINSSEPSLAVSPWLIGAVAVFTGSFFLFVVHAVVRSHRRRAVTGKEGLVGAVGEAKTRLEPQGYVYVQGELWSAISENGFIEPGTKVRVIGMQDLTLLVMVEPSMD